jgi:hypothetical protein
LVTSLVEQAEPLKPTNNAANRAKKLFNTVNRSRLLLDFFGVRD